VKAAILGSGPVGLIAAHAVLTHGHEPVIISDGPKSEINPHEFLQRPVPGLLKDDNVADAMMTYVCRGDRDGYAKKVYGNAGQKVSWDELREGRYPIWWLQETYQQLYDWYEHMIIKVKITPETVTDICYAYPLVISTIPAPSLCQHPDEHRFWERETFLVRAPSIDKPGAGNGQWPRADQNFMLYDGSDDCPWFRFTRIRDVDIWEYTLDRLPMQHEVEDSVPGAQLYPGKKVVGNNCDCHPHVQRVGRWARWEHGVLGHHTYETVVGLLASGGALKEAS